MVYARWLWTIVPLNCVGNLARRRVFSIVSEVFCGHPNSTYVWNSTVRNFRSSRKMMVDAGAPGNQGLPSLAYPEKEDNGRYHTGGCKSEDGTLSCGYSSFRGKRANMEDFYDVKMLNIEARTVCMFGIFDGHGGSRAAEYLKGHLFENLLTHSRFMADTKLAISETYKKTDMDFLDSEKDSYRDDGSTASTAVLVGNRLYAANVGDSRTITSKSGRAIPLSEDHKPNRTDERKRIESAGGVVMWAGTWRVGGVLAMSRAFGNRMLKQFVVAEPEIQEVEINEEFELVVLASDGLWDVVPNEDAVSIARTEREPEAAARKLVDIAFTRGSADNITCIVVKFHHQKKEDPAAANHHNNKNLHVSEVKILTGDQPTENKIQQAGHIDCGNKEDPAVNQAAQSQSHLDHIDGPDGQKANQGSLQREYQGKDGSGGKPQPQRQHKERRTDQQVDQADQCSKADPVGGQHQDKAGPTTAPR